MIKGWFFKLNYNIIIGKTKDIEGYTIEKYPVDKVDLTEDGVGFNCNGYYNLFSDEETYVIDDELIYIEKSEQRYEYYPNNYFDECYCMNWDIDDFIDDEDGWDRYIEACEYEREKYENSIQKTNYEGFITSGDLLTVEHVLDKVIEEFKKENTITKDEE